MRALSASVLVFCLALLITACSASQPLTPTLTPSPTSTPAPTGTPTPTPTATPTPTPIYPASLSPEDQQWLAAHEGDPNVSWAYDEATGNTTVTINSDFDITNPALAGKIDEVCRGDCDTYLSEWNTSAILIGVNTGNRRYTFDSVGGVEIATSMAFKNDKGEVQTVDYLVILGTKTPENAFLWNALGLSGDTVSLGELEEIFGAGKGAYFGFKWVSGNGPYDVKYLNSRFDSKYWQRIRSWFEQGMNPDEKIVLVVDAVVGSHYLR